MGSTMMLIPQNGEYWVECVAAEALELAVDLSNLPNNV